MTLRRKAFQSVASLILQSAANKPASSLIAARQPFFSAASQVAPLPQFTKFTGSSRIALAFGGAAALMTVAEPPTAMAQPKVVSAPDGSAANGNAPATSQQSYKVAFVLGGPGSGKGTQSARLVEEFGVVHLSAGDLLRAHMKSGTPDGKMVADMIANGQIVPSSVTVGLLQSAMDASGNTKFLIDGFPRNEENRAAFEVQTGIQPSFVLFFDCPQEVMEARLLGRNEGRTDDNIETIRKRFNVFVGQSVPVVEHYEQQHKVARIRADRPPEEVYKEVRRAYLEFMV